jgi:glycosyltransferase involved in cell wall biosynthesis
MKNAEVRILYVSHSAHLYGAERSLLQLLATLDKTKFRPIVVLPKHGPLKEYLERLDMPVEVVPSMRPWLTRRKGIMSLAYFVAVLPFILISVLAIMRIIQRYQVKLVHSNTMVVIDGALAAWCLGIPHVWHARAILAEPAPHRFFLGYRAALATVLKLSDRVIAISRAVARCFHGIEGAEKVRVVYNAVDIQSFARDELKFDCRRQLGISEDVAFIGQIAHVIAVKGYTDFIRAIPIVHKTMPNARFIGVGGMPHASYKATIAQLVKDLDLGESLIMTGFREDVSQIVTALDVAVLASNYEPFGRALVEAMAAGKPVIGTRVGGIPEIIEDGVTGFLVPPGSPEELARAIIRILQDPDLAQRMGAVGRERAETRFSPERYVTQVQQVYEELI